MRVKVLSRKLNTLYDGDTLHAFARFQKKPEGTVTLTASLENGETFTQTIDTRKTAFVKTETDLPDTLARLTAACEIQSMIEPKETAALAVKYQLMSPQTNYLAIEVKAEDEKAGDLPALRKTTQVLAAGWGGTGTVVGDISYQMEVSHDFEVTRKRIEQIDAKALRKLSHPTRSRKLKNFLNIDSNLDTFIEVLNKLHNANKLAVSSIQDLEYYSLPEEISNKLVELSKSGVAENIIVVVFLYLLSHRENFKNTTSRQLKRVIAKAYKQLHDVDEEIVRKIEKIVRDNV